MSRKPIHVTRTFLPPQSDYMDLLEVAWNNRWITNRGELVRTLEERLQQRMGSLKELFGVLQQVASDAQAQFHVSLTQLDHPDRNDFLVDFAGRMGQASRLPEIAEIERLLIVDDVYDSGRSLEALIAEIQHQAGGQSPSDIRIACPWYKPSMTRVDRVPDYFIHQDDNWLVFPHELCGLEREEIARGKTDLKDILDLF